MPVERNAAYVAVLATLDTKREEAEFVADRIRAHGLQPWVVDLSLGSQAAASADTPRSAVAAQAGWDVDDLVALPRAEAMEVVGAAAGQVLGQLLERGDVGAALGIGGGTGTWLAERALADLPHGFPKLIVSTLTGRDASRDVMVLPSVVDIAGVNRLLAPVLTNAAAAACGMATAAGPAEASARPTIAVTMFGVTTTGGTHLRRLLSEAGCEVVVFHANGTGGRTMERLAAEGAFSGVIDWTTSEITDELVDGICTAGPERLEAAGAAGVPQVVVPGAIDVINVAGEIPERFASRPHHWHLPTVPLIRTSAEESARIGAWMADKLNAARGPVRIVVPDKGFSALDAPGEVFEDREADQAWIDAVRREAREDISVEIADHHINDEAFARAAASALLNLLEAPAREAAMSQDVQHTPAGSDQQR